MCCTDDGESGIFSAAAMAAVSGAIFKYSTGRGERRCKHDERRCLCWACGVLFRSDSLCIRKIEVLHNDVICMIVRLSQSARTCG